jgi:hypothetical protein
LQVRNWLPKYWEPCYVLICVHVLPCLAEKSPNGVYIHLVKTLGHK